MMVQDKLFPYAYVKSIAEIFLKWLVQVGIVS